MPTLLTGSYNQEIASLTALSRQCLPAAPAPSKPAVKLDHNPQLGRPNYLALCLTNPQTPSNFDCQFDASSSPAVSQQRPLQLCDQLFKLNPQSFQYRLSNNVIEMDSRLNAAPPAQVSVACVENVSASPPPSAEGQATIQNQHDSYYNSYPTSTCPSSSHSSPDPSSSFANQNGLQPIVGYVLNGSAHSGRSVTGREKGGTEESLPHPKRLRTTTSFSQIDGRNFEKPSHLVLASSHHATSTDDIHYRVLNGGSEVDNVKTLPPIVTREERAQSTARVGSLTRAAANDEEYGPGSTADSDEIRDNSSSYKPTDANSNPSAQLDRQFSNSPIIPTNQLSVQPPASSDPPSFSNLQHEVPTASHLESPLSLSSHHSHSHLSVHPTGHMSSLPSPLTPVNGHHSPHALHHRASYPGSPTVAMAAPNSAAFSGATSSSFAPLSPPVSQEPPPPAYCNSASAFPHHATAHLVGSSYPTSGAAQGVHGGITHATRSLGSEQLPAPSPTVSKPENAQWATNEGQPPRRRGKLPQAVTARLRGWLMAHTSHPYPTEEEKKLLCDHTGLTLNQVSNWFINARRRILIPPTGCNSIHSVRQPVRRQAQSQLARAAAVSAAPGIALHSSVPPSPAATSPTFSNGTFDFRYPHFDGCHRSTSGGSQARPPSSPVPGHYASYPASYPLPPSSSPTTPHYETPAYYGAYYPPPPDAHHLAPPSRLNSPRSQPNTPGYSPQQVAFHAAAETHEAYSRSVSAQHHHHQSHSRPSSSEMQIPIKREWQHTQTEADSNGGEIGN